MPVSAKGREGSIPDKESARSNALGREGEELDMSPRHSKRKQATYI